MKCFRNITLLALMNILLNAKIFNDSARNGNDCLLRARCQSGHKELSLPQILGTLVVSQPP